MGSGVGAPHLSHQTGERQSRSVTRDQFVSDQDSRRVTRAKRHLVTDQLVTGHGFTDAVTRHG